MAAISNRQRRHSIFCAALLLILFQLDEKLAFVIVGVAYEEQIENFLKKEIKRRRLMCLCLWNILMAPMSLFLFFFFAKQIQCNMSDVLKSWRSSKTSLRYSIIDTHKRATLGLKQREGHVWIQYLEFNCSLFWRCYKQQLQVHFTCNRIADHIFYYTWSSIQKHQRDLFLSIRALNMRIFWQPNVALSNSFSSLAHAFTEQSTYRIPGRRQIEAQSQAMSLPFHLKQT